MGEAKITISVDGGAIATDVFRSISTEAEKVGPAIGRIGSNAQEAKGFFSDLSGEVTKVAVGFVSAQAVTEAVAVAYHELSQFVGDSVRVFADAEAADVKLVAALRQHSLATPDVIAQYRELGTTFQQTTVFSNTEIAAMQALLTQVGGIMPSAMQGALKASTDLAAGLGVDLQTATMLVAKAAVGHTETLGRYGVTVSAAALESKGFAAVLEAVNRQFGGQAQAAVETYSGQVAQLSNDWVLIEEAAGKFVVQNEFAVAGLRLLKQAAEDADTATAHATPSVAGLAGALGGSEIGLAVALIEGYVASVNDAARLAKQIADVPSPFKKWAADGALPAITLGMAIFNAELETTKTLAELDDATFKLAMEHGKQWRGEATTALHAKNAEVIAGLSEIKTAEGALEDYRMQRTLSTTDYEIFKIRERVAAEEAGFKGSIQQRQVYIAAVEDLANQQIFALLKQTRDADVATVSSFDLMNTAVMGLDTSFASWNKSIMAVNASLDATAAAKNRAMGNTLDVAHAAEDPAIMALLKSGWSLANAEALKLSQQYGFTPKLYDPLGNPESSPSAGERVPGYIGGGPTGPGGLSLLHPDEYVVPKDGALVSGGGGGITINTTVNVTGMVDTRMKRDLTDIVSEGIVQKLKDQGWRPPLGARR